ncbi:MAG: hypothetical protein NTZ38_02185, partial [Candidatus Taylorbacteria bacterium]|nr:hypothetical protein [Candidatus Taylorbacteria bacterium]
MNISDKNKRRIASLILLCLAVVFGKNFDEKVEKGTYDSLILSLNDQIDSLDNGILKLDNNRKTVTKQDFITLENGGIGRITFQASYNPMVGDSSLENSNQNKEAILQVWSSSSGSEASLLQSFTL